MEEALVIDEQAIIRRAKDGDTAAMELLVQENKEQVFKIISRMVGQHDIDDVAQEVFIRVFEDLGSYRGLAPFQHWISKIAVRTANDFWRKEKRHKAVSSMEQQSWAFFEKAASEESFSVQENRDQAREVVEAVLSRLAPADRLLVTLIYIEGWSNKEAARFLGWSLSNVKVRAFRARHRLQRLLNSIKE